MEDDRESNSEDSYSGDDSDYLPENNTSNSDVTQSEKEDLDVHSSRRKTRKCARERKNTKHTQPDKSDSDGPNTDGNYTPVKNNFCFVCGTGLTEIFCHLKTHAEDIPEIAEAFAFPPGSKEQTRLFNSFLTKSPYNQEVLQNNSGELTSMSDKATANSKTHVSQNEVELPENLSPDAQTILENMKLGRITSLVKKDYLLVHFAQYLCDRYGDGPYKYDYVTQRLRSIGRVLLTLRKDSIFSFEEALKPGNFDKVVEAVKHSGRFNNETQCYDKPQVVLRLAYFLRKLATIAIREACGDAQKKKNAKKFMQVCSEEWSNLDSKNGSITQVATTKNRLAFTRDLQRLYRYLKTTSAAAVKILNKHDYPNVYSALCKVTLAQVSLFNKCAPEISKMKLRTFQDRNDSTQVLSQHVIKINILHRSGQTLSVLLTQKLANALSLLVNKREACGVHKSNPFLFAKCDFSCKSAYHSSHCIKRLSRLCGVRNAQYLTSPAFYKEMARMFHILNLGDDELQYLARLLGRDIPTNRNHYQYLKAAPDLAEITTLLLSMEKCKGHSFMAIASNGALEPGDGQQCEDSGPAKEDECNSLVVQRNNMGLTLHDSIERKTKTRKERKRGEKERKRKRQDSEESGLGCENTEEKTAEKHDEHEEQPAAKTPGKKSPDRIDKLDFNDTDEDMNVDFEVDLDSEEDRKEDDGGDTALKSTSGEEKQTAEDQETVEQKKWMNVVNTTPSEKAAGTNKTDSSSEKERRGKRKRLESEASESNLETNEETITKKDNKPAMTAVRLLRSDTDFSDNNEDINVDLHLDVDADRDRYEKNEGENHRKSTLVTPEMNDNNEERKSCTFEVEKHSQKKKQQNVDVDVNGLCTEVKNKVLAALCGRKKLKIIVPKMNIEKPSAKSSTEMKDRPVAAHVNKDQVQLSPKPADSKDRTMGSGNRTMALGNRQKIDKVVHMICSRCHKPLMKGQTAYQKEGFSEVFCSKHCLFEKFAIGKPVVKSCYHCGTVISKPLDIIMAAVDTNNTMKEFCSQSCLSWFRSKTSSPSPCDVCSALCTATCELKLNGVVLKFCGKYCLKSFFNMEQATCENCHTLCDVKPLKLKMEHEVINICKEECLKHFIKGITAPRRCHVCECFCPMSEMFYFQNENHTVELLCSFSCRMSYKISLSLTNRFKGNKATSAHLKNNNQSRQSLNKDDGALSQSNYTPTMTVSESDTSCHRCQTLLLKGQNVYKVQISSISVVFCSTGCFSLPDKTCLNVIDRPQKVILAPDDSGTLRELCSLTCLSSATANWKSTQSHHKCNMCSVNARCKYTLTVNSEPIKMCSDTCYINYHKVNQLPVFSCDVCGQIYHNERFSLKMEEGTHHVCSDGCLNRFRESVKTPQLCSTCQSSHLLSDMVEHENSDGRLTFFCSSRCMMMFKAQNISVSDIKTPPPELQDSKEEKPLVPYLSSIKEELIDEGYNHSLRSSESTEVSEKPVIKKEEVALDSMFLESLRSPEDAPRSPVVAHLISPTPCSNCDKVPCLCVCNMNHLSACSNCGSCCRTPLQLQMKDDRKPFCSAECLDQFKKTIKTPEPCAMCHSPHTVAEMVEDKNSKDTVELFCSSSCLKASKIQAVSASGKPQACDNCEKTRVPACHLVMSDFSVRSFCTLTCSMAFKENKNTAANPIKASNQTQSDVFKSTPEQLLCAQCQRIIKITPKVVLNNGTMDFLCSQACAMNFNIDNNIRAICEYCSNKNIIRDCLFIDGKKCCFCSDDCKILFRHKVGKTWGNHCGSCAYCLCCSKTLVTEKYEDTTEEFCSEICLSDYNKLLDHMACCDACGRRGKLTQSLPLIGEVKHFCDLKCLFYFCHKKGQINPAPEPAATEESYPVIAGVVSLASSRRQKDQTKAAPQKAPDIQTNIMGHASVQTDPREMKNKSVLCTPLVHNKGVSCLTQTVTAQTQTEKEPQLLVIPVPVYVPVPLNLYSQFTPTPLGLPLPFPVPILIPESKKRNTQCECAERNETEETQKEPADEQISVTTKQRETPSPSIYLSRTQSQ